VSQHHIEAIEAKRVEPVLKLRTRRSLNANKDQTMTVKTQRLDQTRQGSGKRFDADFQREAVALLEAGRSATQLSRELGVSTWSLSRWKKAHHAAGAAGAGQAGRSPILASGGEASSMMRADELLRLRHELNLVTRQRDILKKALGILSQEPPSVTR